MYDYYGVHCYWEELDVFCARQAGFRRSGVRGFGYMLPPHPHWPKSDQPYQTRAVVKKNKPSRSTKPREFRLRVHSTR